jgi:hypothetical protein
MFSTAKEKAKLNVENVIDDFFVYPFKFLWRTNNCNFFKYLQAFYGEITLACLTLLEEK